MFEKWKEEKIFLVLALIFGLLIVFLVPPVMSPDEDSHIKKIYSITKGRILPIKSNNKLGNYFPKEMLDYITYMKDYIGKSKNNYDYNFYVSNYNAKLKKNNEVFNDYSTANTNIFVYIPQVLAILFFKIITFKSISIGNYFYLGRIGNLLSYIFLIYNAIKKLPFSKKLMLFISLMPMSIYLGSSLNYDAVLIGISFFAISYILNLIYSRDVKITKKDFYLFVFLSYFLLEFKFVYFPIVLLIFLVPKEKLKDKKWILFLKIFLGVLVLKIIYNIIFKTGVSGLLVEKKMILSQIYFILRHPIKYIIILYNTYNLNKDYYITSFVGNFGWLDTPMNILFSIFYMGLLVFISNFETRVINIKSKIYIFGISIFIYLLMFTSMYITWTTNWGIGYEAVEGVQGRYFIPFSFLILILFNLKITKMIKLKKETIKTIKFYILPSLLLFSLIFSCLTIFIRFWI